MSASAVVVVVVAIAVVSDGLASQAVNDEMEVGAGVEVENTATRFYFIFLSVTHMKWGSVVVWTR